MLNNEAARLDCGLVIVTGGSGFIGSAIVWALNRLGIEDVLVVDRLDRSEKWKNLVPLRFRDYIEAADFESLITAQPASLKDVSTVIHMGACSSTTETDAAFLIKNNFEYTKTLAKWAVSRGARFVYASSAATYGAEERDLFEDEPLELLRPLNMYAYSKHLFDLYAQRSGLLESITGLKFFNVFGPNESHKGDMRSLVDKAFHQIKDGGTIRLFRSHRHDYADGEQRRDFIYVKDAVSMTLHLAQQKAYGLYNIGSGEAHTWLDLVRPIFKALNAPERIEFIDMPDTLRSKYQYYTCAQINKIRSTGYTAPITDLAEAVTDYVTNYLVSDQRLDPIQKSDRTFPALG